ncbi:hypothetical protein L1049_024030 [Liquidambar formosana]|uniref:Uncharacterized protein n=1 Tax=Liquidambar formosana TaxID=63359 RepID=A0AAP0RU84_LIQFO
MILNCGAIVVPRRPPWRTVRLASNIDTEQLRAQLGQLHSEAEKTRTKANNARLRLLRLSEAAEKLRRQAAISVETGKENNARELLFQKKKVMQALEKSKSRIELLDELSTKLNEAISIKETQLIGNVALDLEVGKEDASGPVRIVSPKEEVLEHLNENKDFDANALKFSEDKKIHFCAESQANLPADSELESLGKPVSGSIWNEDDMISSLRGISSFKDFLEHLDQQLDNIEAELVTVLRLSTLVLESEEKSINSKLLLIEEILQSIRDIRGRIASFIR